MPSRMEPMPDRLERREIERPIIDRERILRAMERINEIEFRDYDRSFEHYFHNHEMPSPERIRELTPAFIGMFNSYADTYRQRTDLYETPTLPKTLKSINSESISAIIKASLKATTSAESESKSSITFDLEPCPSETRLLAEKFYGLISSEENRQYFPLDYSEEKFIEAVKADKKSIPHEVDDRIIRSQHSALHALMFSGGLDSLYSKYIASCHDNGTPIPSTDEQILNIKTQLASNFLEHIAQKNSEKIYSEVESGAITVGVEVEYQNHVKQELRSKSIYENLVKTMEEMAINAKTSIEQDVYRKFAQKTQKRIDRLNLILEGLGEKNAKDLYDDREPGVKTAIELEVLRKSSAFNETKETVTRPARSYKTQLRELVAAASLGGLGSEWGIHETFGRIKLTKDHTEFMDGLPIAAASGLLDFDTVKEGLANNVEIGYSVISEKYTKPEHEGDGVVYFPFHRARTTHNLEKLSMDDKGAVAIELRSLPEFKVGSFPKFARQLSFHFYFAHSVKSLQKDPSQRTVQDTQLISAHQELMAAWTSLLSEQNISLPENEDKYMTGVDASNEDVRDKNKYLVFLSKVVILGQKDKTFAKKVRGLIRGFSMKTKTILEAEA